jgi:hypothetical protein
MGPQELQADRDLIEDLFALSSEIVDAHKRHESASVWLERRTRIAGLRQRVWLLRKAHRGTSFR